jgi:hypothetical protein
MVSVGASHISKQHKVRERDTPNHIFKSHTNIDSNISLLSTVARSLILYPCHVLTICPPYHEVKYLVNLISTISDHCQLVTEAVTEATIAKFVQMFQGKPPDIAISVLCALFRLDCEDALPLRGSEAVVEQVFEQAAQT